MKLPWLASVGLLASSFSAPCLTSSASPSGHAVGLTCELFSGAQIDLSVGDDELTTLFQHGFSFSTKGDLASSPPTTDGLLEHNDIPFAGFVDIGSYENTWREGVEVARLPEEGESVQHWLEGTTILDITPLIWCLYAFILALTCLHEIHVWCGGFPLLAQQDPSQSAAIQIHTVFHEVLFGSVGSLMIPLSLDVAVASHIPISLSAISASPSAPIAVFIAILILKDGSSWNQKLARRFLVGANVMNALVAGGIAFVYGQASRWSDGGRLATWIVYQVVVLQFLAGGMALYSFVTLTVQNMVCRVEDKTFWSMIRSGGKTLGLVVGPALYTVVQVLLRSTEINLNPLSNWSWVILVIGFHCCVASLLCSLIYTDYVAVDEESEAQKAQLSAMDHLDTPTRQSIFWNLILFHMARGIAVGSMQVATAMILELEYSWLVGYTGLGFAGISLGASFFSVLSAVVVKERHEGRVLVTCMVISVLGCVCFFDIGGYWVLLCGDFVVYGATLIAGGIVDSWVQHACLPGTFYSYENFLGMEALRVTFAMRLVAPIAARSLLEQWGRNSYAFYQLAAIVLASGWTVRAHLMARMDSKPKV